MTMARREVFLPKGQQYLTALDEWLANNPTASSEDISAAREIHSDLADALEGR